jgi:phosphate transport system substrate-binding protein
MIDRRYASPPPRAIDALVIKMQPNCHSGFDPGGYGETKQDALGDLIVNRILLALPLAALLAGCNNGSAQKGGSATGVTGAGSTFVYPVLSAWAADYRKQAGVDINYQSIGSGGGIAQVKAGTVDFGASDKPLKPEELAQSRLAQFPLVIGGVVPVVNISGIGPGKLRLTGPLLADIYIGKVNKWNDAAIAQLNPGVSLPPASISVVHRSDGSGTTFNWVHYLSQVSATWKGGPGEGTSVAWPTGVGGKGNEGVAAYVKQIPNSIGYLEYAYVTQNKMAYTLVQNASGNFVAPGAQTFSSAAESADWKNAKEFDLVMTNAPGPNAYPITATTFILMPKKAPDAAKSKAALTFFKFALDKGQERAKKLDYVPLPNALVQQVESYISANIQ